MTDNDELERGVAHALQELFPEPGDVSLMAGVQARVQSRFQRRRRLTRGGIELTAAAAVAAAIAVPVTLTHNGSGGTTSGSASSCKPGVLTFEGRRYVETVVDTHPVSKKIGEIPKSHLHIVGEGSISPCRDTNHSRDRRRLVEVARIDGVKPTTAVATLPTDAVDAVYLRQGAALPTALTSAPWIRWVTP